MNSVKVIEPDFSRHKDENCAVLIDVLDYATHASEYGEESCFFYKLACDIKRMTSIDDVCEMASNDKKSVVYAGRMYLQHLRNSHSEHYNQVQDVFERIEEMMATNVN